MGYLVRIIRQDKATAVIEWDDGHLHRSIVPASIIRPDGTVDRPQEGVPYGVQFYAPDASITITGAQIQDALHRRGVWNEEDLAANPNAALSALFEVAGLSLSELTRRTVFAI